MAPFVFVNKTLKVYDDAPYIREYKKLILNIMEYYSVAADHLRNNLPAE